MWGGGLGGKLILGILISFAFVVLAFAGDTITFEADVYPMESTVGIDVTSFADFGNLTVGSSTDKIRVNITNTGNVNVIVTPQLIDGGEEIFSYLYFARRTTEPYKRIGSFSMNVTKGDDDYCYAKLDLSDFSGTVSSPMIGHRADVKFIAVAS